VSPAAAIFAPSTAIMPALSRRKQSSGAKKSAPRSAHIAASIACSRRFCPTPPPRTSSPESVSESARSLTSASIPKTVSWSEKQTSSTGVPSSTAAFAALSSPEKEKSIPLTT
jgi:hypothetical protein